jgi:hypothetical protein
MKKTVSIRHIEFLTIKSNGQLKMKKLITILIIVLMMLIVSSTISGQKIMKLDDDLKANSEPIEAKLKGISAVGKYEFSPYRIISGKAGWGTSKSSKDKFNSETYTESKSKSSFVFTVNDKDTILVNTTTSTKFNEGESKFLFGDMTTLNKSIDNYVALISPLYDTTAWKMILVTKMGAEVEGKSKAEGILSNGLISVQIRAIKQWDDGKTAPFKMICGYAFILDNKEIAAVQSNDLSAKKYVWLHKDLDGQMKSILAAASASIMIHIVDPESH